MSGLQVRLFGPLEVLVGSERVPLTGSRLGALVAVLALSAGSEVSIGVIVNAIWDRDPPQRARETVRVYVNRLRKVIGDEHITTHRGGYRLNIAPGAVDVLEFLRLSEEPPGSDEEHGSLRRALELWRGPPFAGVRSPWLATYEAPSLTDRYLTTVVRCAELDFAAGRDVLPVLRSAAATYPWCEPLWELMMSVLAKSGRRAEALQIYEDVRQRFTSDGRGGLGSRLRQIHAELLLADRRSEPNATAAVPRQLPQDLRHFTGRGEALAALDQTTLSREPGRGVAVGVSGPGGVGKTTLVVHWAHSVRQHFPGGQLYLELHAYGAPGPTEPAEAMATLLQGLGVSRKDVPAEPDERRALLGRLLSSEPILVILDNARDAGEVDAILPPSAATVIVTSRRVLTGAPAEWLNIALEPMPPAESTTLLRRLLHTHGCEVLGPRADDDLNRLAELCGHLPLALAIVAERAGVSTEELSDFVTRISAEQDQIDVLQTNDDPASAVRAVFEWSYCLLDEPVARTFRLLGLQPGPDISVSAASALAGVSPSEVEHSLRALAEVSLATGSGLGRYKLHDLIRQYARRLAIQEETQFARDAAIGRLLHFYLHTANHARATLDPARGLLELDGMPEGVRPLSFFEVDQAVRWFGTEGHTIRSAVRFAAGHGFHRLAANLTRTLWDLLHVRNELRDWIPLQQLALESAELTGDVLMEARLTNQLGISVMVHGDLESALHHFESAARRFERAGDERGLAPVLNNMGIVLRRLNRLAEAERCLVHAVALNARITPGRTSALNTLAMTYLARSDLQHALSSALEAVRLSDGGSQPDHAAALDTLGQVLAAKRCYSDAIAAFSEAHELRQRLGDRRNDAVSLVNLGRAQAAVERHRHAAASFEQALMLYEEAGGVDSVELHRDEIVTLLVISREHAAAEASARVVAINGATEAMAGRRAGR